MISSYSYNKEPGNDIGDSSGFRALGCWSFFCLILEAHSLMPVFL